MNSLSNYGFIRVASAVPRVKIADCQWNISLIERMIEEAEENHASIIVFPELSITGYTCGDLFNSHLLLDQTIEALNDIVCYSQEHTITIIVGAPINTNNQLFNCAVVIHKGSIIAIVPKTYLPNYNEFYEMRWFSSAMNANVNTISLLGQEDIPFGNDIILSTEEYSYAIEICEDLWTPIPPSSLHSLAGAQIIFNLSASNELIGKNNYLLQLIEQQSSRTISAYVYSSAGYGESSTDLVYTGNSIIAEKGVILNKNQRFVDEPQITYADIDLDRINSDRQKNSTFKTGLNGIRNTDYKPRYIKYSSPTYNFDIDRYFSPTPFIPTTKDMEDSCEEILNIQATGLYARLKHINCTKMVIGISGGLDSTLAFLVCIRVCDMMQIDYSNIIGVTMPGFGTTNRTYTNAIELITKMGATLKEISIKEACIQHFKDIEHDPNVRDITYENSQARERTQILMDISNQYNGIVIGTGDLSELALGWATYNGDQMSMYAVNASIPKTLIKYLVQYASEHYVPEHVKNNLLDVIETPVSPELLPSEEDGSIAQKTEDIVGPYEIHDFCIYYTLRYGYTPKKILYIAKKAFKDQYTEDELHYWLKNFFRRFFAQQFKRSCMPDSPKVGSVCLSPRGDWRMPSDATNRAWLDDLL